MGVGGDELDDPLRGRSGHVVGGRDGGFPSGGQALRRVAGVLLERGEAEERIETVGIKRE